MYRDACQAVAAPKRMIADTRHTVGNNRCLATEYQLVGCCFYYCITVVAAVVDTVARTNCEAYQAGAVPKRIPADTRHAVANRDACQTGAAPKRIPADICHAVLNDNGFEPNEYEYIECLTVAEGEMLGLDTY